MRGRNLRLGSTWVILLLVTLVLPALASVARADGPLDEADAAFTGGEHERALELYEQVLADDPGQIRAWVRSGLLLSWSKRFDEAIERYDRALELEPDNRKARLERAKVLSWDGRLPEAAEAFQLYLEDNPDDRQAQLALARCLAWMGRYDESREAFARILEEDPNEISALVGTAQTYAWSGRLADAERTYRRALAADPDNREARMGLGYVYLWTGSPGRSREHADALIAAHPDDDEVQQFAERVAVAASPWIRTDLEAIDDSDDNELRIFRVMGGFGISRHTGLELGVARYDMEDPILGDASIDELFAALGIRPGLGQKITVRAGLDRREATSGDTDNELVGGVHYQWGLDGPWQIAAGAHRVPIRYSPRITDNGVVYDELSLSARGRVAPRWRIFGSYGVADYSDDNSRDLAIVGATYDLPVKPVRLQTGYAFRFMDFSENTNSGYFDPQDFIAHLLQFNAHDEWGARKNTWRFSTEFGIQSFELNGIETSNDRILVFTGAATFPLGRALTLELLASWGDYAALTAAGFKSRQVTVRLRWRLGS